MMMADPQVLIEGVIITGYASAATRPSSTSAARSCTWYRRLLTAVGRPTRQGLARQRHPRLRLRPRDRRPRRRGRLHLRRGDGAAGLAGGAARPATPQAAVPGGRGLYARPTVVNNVESIASVPSIVAQRRRMVQLDGHGEVAGFGLFSLSGHVTRPGQYEAPLGHHPAGAAGHGRRHRAGHRLKFWTPGGSSTPMFTDEHLDTPLDFESVGAAGSMLGTRALQLFDDTTCVVRAVLRWTEFYEHESCGKCTPCREGTYWLVQILRRLEAGDGTEADLAKLLDICDNILGRSFCALGDGATSPITSSVQYFRDEYIRHFEEGGCPFDPVASTVFAGVHA